MDQNIKALKENPIFRMSLGSKELFHSNFLEFLWDVDQEAFKKLINAFFPCTFIPGRNYLFGREKKNFDICIFHKEKGKGRGEIDVYDLIIENKVKSIPYKEQLMKYKKVAELNNVNCRFILLTLSDQFLGKTDINEQWIIVRYCQLRAIIVLYYLKLPNNCSSKDKEYIKDYCDFIKQLNDLVGKIIPQNISNLPLFVKDDIEKLKVIRLHDLYIKLRCSWFVGELRKRITIQTQMVHKFSDVGQGRVNLNIDINQGNGQVAAWICNGENNVFEIVIQGNQYRHGINQRNISTSAVGTEERLNDLYDRLKNLSDNRPLVFLNFENNIFSTSVKPQTNKKFQKSMLQKRGPFNCYGKDYIYRYIQIDEKDCVEKLFEMMLNDINDIYTNIPCLF